MAQAKNFITQHKKFITGVVIVFGVLAASVGLFVFVLSGFAQFDADDYKTNLYTEVFGVLFSVLISVAIVGGLAEIRARQHLKARLKREAGSRSNDIAISAVEWLREKKWLTGEKGLLKKADLVRANLKETDLSFANLQGADLFDANLQEAGLLGANLQGAGLLGANLLGADLRGANLQGAGLRGANLQEADLTDADLRKADLTDANLQNANLRLANLEGATLHIVNLQGVDLGKVDLKSADLFGANLQDANLDRANLEKANLRNVNLEKADLRGAYMEGATVSLSEEPVATRWGEPGEPGTWKFLPPTLLRGATLPDGAPFPEDPSLHDELERFTNPEHPEFYKTLEKIKEIHRAWEEVE